MLMRDGILMSALLNNAETWINITKKNTMNLEKPDKMLQEKLFEIKSSKVFYYLELRILPAKYVIMKKRLKFLKYILDEPMETMITQVFEEQRKETRKGDFINLISDDFEKLELKTKFKEIEQYTKFAWNNLINSKTEHAAFKALARENENKSKTKHIVYKKLEMSDYLCENRNTNISKTIYSIRAGSLDLKQLNPWKYYDNLCVMCSLKEESFDHLMNCNSYGRKNIFCEDIFQDMKEKQFEIGKEAMIRMKIREKKKEEDGQASSLVPTAPDRPVCRA